jgi:methylenetetrahydrofolate dehydrogenase (NADP+)/methenyltetrahydrofolate cyclohydrolase
MSARIIDGKAIAEKVRGEVKEGVTAFQSAHGRVPGLDVILVGEHAPSVVYTRNKEKAALEVGIRGRLHRMPDATTQEELLAMVAALSADESVDGILIQLPLPKHIDERTVLLAIPPEKDVDGFHPINVGRLSTGQDALVPCTPLGSLRLLDEAGVNLKGANAIVIGRSNIVGKPMAQLLLSRDATVTIAHSRTSNLAGLCATMDVVIAAVGRAEMVKANWIKPGATVIDVGINRIELADGKTRLVGDVAFAECKEVAGAITPVPGGVGPMTIAILLQNTLMAAKARARVSA